MNNAIFKEQKIWRNEVKTENGTFDTYSISVSSRNQDDTWTNAYIPVRFAKSAGAPEKISNGTVADLEGFFTARKRKDGKGELSLMVMKAKFYEVNSVDDISGVDSFEQATEDIPF